MLKINPPNEKSKIVSFIKNVLKKQGFKNVVIGMSGGIDSTASFYLIKEAIPPQNIIIAHLYYSSSQFKDIKPITKKVGIPKENIYEISIDPFVKVFQEELSLNSDKIRLGNIMARIRMIILYDLAKKHNALVAGTENRSEYYLGYFTRFGDQASDFEPIQHLYKTQIFQLWLFDEI